MDLKEIAKEAVNAESNEVVDIIVETESPIVIGEAISKNEVEINNEEVSKTVVTTTVSESNPTPIIPTGINLDIKRPLDIDSNLDKLPVSKQLEYKEYKQELINNGMSEYNANKMMNQQIDKELALSSNVATETPLEDKLLMDGLENLNKSDVAVIEIDKKSANVDDLALSPEEHEKLQKVKAIQLIVVEDQDLKSIKIDKVKSNHKAEYIKTIEGSLTNYGVPLPTLGDFMVFKGAQVIQLASAVTYEDEDLSELISKKASLVYDKMYNGKVLKKIADNGKVNLTYNAFANIFPFGDLDMALYAILVASSMEETEAQIPCEKCSHEFDHKYNLKQILDLDDIPDAFKERIDNILGNKNNSVELKKLSDDIGKTIRFKSPFTNNIYDVSYPTVARAVNIFEKIDQKDNVMVYLATLAIYLTKMYIYNPSTDGYVEIDESETEVMLEAISDVPDEDYKLLLSQLQERYIYSPKFKIKAKCPNCGHDNDLDLNIESLVFLKAQDSYKEIR